MLVLTRHLNEAIRIGDGVIIKILTIDSNNVKIGIEAPKDVPVLREEIYERIKEENRNASKVDYANAKNIADLLKGQVKKKLPNENYSLIVYDNDKNKNIILETFSENSMQVMEFDLREDKQLLLEYLPQIIILNISDESRFKVFCEQFSALDIKTPVLALNIPSAVKFNDTIQKKICMSADFSDWEQIRKQITNMLKLKINPVETLKASFLLRGFPFSISINK